MLQVAAISILSFVHVQGTINFDSQENMMSTLGLILLPIIWGFKGYMALKEQEYKYQAHLSALWLLKNLNNNAGVISKLLGEAQEQEDNEGVAAARSLSASLCSRGVVTWVHRELFQNT